MAWRDYTYENIRDWHVKHPDPLYIFILFVKVVDVYPPVHPESSVSEFLIRNPLGKSRDISDTCSKEVERGPVDLSEQTGLFWEAGVKS